MTNEEAIELLCAYGVPLDEDKFREALNMAIKALKQTDRDLISRDYVLSKFKEQCDRCGKYKENNGVMCNCCALDAAIYYVEDAPSAEKTAEWIFRTSKSAKCSNCGHIQFTNGEDTTKKTLIHKALYHYCPMCGAKMKEGEKEE